jgi:hypothetical protein
MGCKFCELLVIFYVNIFALELNNFSVFKTIELIIEKQSPLQVTHYWLNVRPTYHDWFRSYNY